MEKEPTSSHRKRKWRAKHQQRKPNPYASSEATAYKTEYTRKGSDHGRRRPRNQSRRDWR